MTTTVGTNKPLRIACLSDIHLGHKNTPTEYILTNLRKSLTQNILIRELDIIILAGDIFDTLLYLPDFHIGEIQIWIAEFLHQCVKYDICLRIVEGTPSHDRKQAKQFIILNRLLNINADVIYHDSLTIEYLAKHDLHILYVPDEWRSNTMQTQLEVTELLYKHQLTQVDYAVMHGMFEHQGIGNIPMPIHNSEYYLSIVKKYIFIGHIHLMSTYQRILVQGSFDRLAHGEEEPKGFWLVIANRNTDVNDKVTFIINHQAMPYLSYDITGLSETAIHRKLASLKTLVAPAFIRIIMAKHDPNKALLLSYKENYTQFKWTFKITDTNIPHITQVIPTLYTTTPINQNTILSFIEAKLTQDNISNELKNHTLTILSSLTGE